MAVLLETLKSLAPIKPLIVLLLVFAVFAGISYLLTDSWNVYFAGDLAMCCMLCFSALGHFLFTKGMAMMIPPLVPFKTILVHLTGVLEILPGLGLLFSSLRLYCGYALLLFFVLVLPANIYAALKHLQIEKGTFTGPGPGYLWFRVPLQLFFIAWLLYFSILPG